MAMRHAILVALLAAGCISDAERAREAEHAREVREAQEADRAEVRRRISAERERQGDLDRICLQPSTEYQINFCTAREREKDRAATRAQWARENAIREQGLDIERQRLEMEQRERQRRAIQEIFPTTPQPKRLDCTSTKSGDTVRTTCD